MLDALAAYEEAYRLEPGELPLRGLAEVAWLLGDPARAHLCYQMLLREHGTTLSPESRAAVERTLAELDFATGTIEFFDLPIGAKIRLNGLEIGVLPLGPLRLNPGEYQVLVEAEGFRSLSVRVRITSGIATVRGPLEPALNAGTLNITVAPPLVADLVVNGIVTGPLPWAGLLPFGDYIIEARSPTHRSQPLQLRVTQGTQHVELALLAARGLVTVRAPSDQTRISIDGQVLGYGQWEGELYAGEHRLRLESPGQIASEERFLLAPGGRVILGRTSTAPPPPGFAERPLPSASQSPAAAPPATPSSSDDGSGVYGALFAYGLFGTASTHQYASECPVLDYGGSCSATAPMGGGLGLRLGYSFGMLGLEGSLLGGVDASFATATLPGVVTDPTLSMFAEESSYVRAGWAPGIGARFFTPPIALRFSAGATFAYGMRKIWAFPDSLEGDTNVTYSAPLILLDAGLQLGSTPGTKLIAGVLAWFEFSEDVTLERNLSALGDQAALVPEELAEVEVYRGTQTFLGLFLGLAFGH